jgi:hypothetical protein
VSARPPYLVLLHEQWMAKADETAIAAADAQANAAEAAKAAADAQANAAEAAKAATDAADAAATAAKVYANVCRNLKVRAEVFKRRDSVTSDDDVEDTGAAAAADGPYNVHNDNGPKKPSKRKCVRLEIQEAEALQSGDVAKLAHVRIKMRRRALAMDRANAKKQSSV